MEANKGAIDHIKGFLFNFGILKMHCVMKCGVFNNCCCEGGRKHFDVALMV